VLIRSVCGESKGHWLRGWCRLPLYQCDERASAVDVAMQPGSVTDTVWSSAPHSAGDRDELPRSVIDQRQMKIFP